MYNEIILIKLSNYNFLFSFNCLIQYLCIKIKNFCQELKNFGNSYHIVLLCFSISQLSVRLCLEFDSFADALIFTVKTIARLILPVDTSNAFWSSSLGED